MSYDHGRFVWFELITASAGKAKAFYPEVFGWRFETMSMAGGIDYPLLKVGDLPAGGIAPPPVKDMPSHWISYVSVADVDGAAKKVIEHGGKSLMDAFDVPGVGRMQPVTDDQGAAFFLFKSADGDPPKTEGPGSFAWNELLTKDPKKAARFYEEVLGYTVETREMPMGTYYVLKNGDAMRGGIMAAPSTDIPPHWVQYVSVEDESAALTRAKRAGGAQVGETIEVADIGRFGFIRDPLGAVIGFLRPAAR